MKKIILLVGNEPLKQDVDMQNTTNIEHIAAHHKLQIFELYDDSALKHLQKIISKKAEHINMKNWEDAVFSREEEWAFIQSHFAITNKYNHKSSVTFENNLLYVMYNVEYLSIDPKN